MSKNFRENIFAIVTEKRLSDCNVTQSVEISGFFFHSDFT